MHRFFDPNRPRGRRSPLRRLPALGLAAITALAALQAPVQADPGIPPTLSLWGYSGLVIVPTAGVHGLRDYSVGATVLTKRSDVRLAPFAVAGVFEGLEFGVLYGVPIENFSGLTGHLKYQLVRPTKDRPTAVAVGLSMVGVGERDRYVEGNNVYLMLSHDFNATFGNATYTLLSGHFGFSGNFNLGARMMGGLEVPLADKGSLVADFLGPMGTTGGFFNLGAVYRITPEWRVRLYSMGVPGAEWTDRDYALSLSYSGNLMGNPAGAGEQPGVKPSSAPSVRPTPAPSPALRSPAPLPSLPTVPKPAVSLVPSPIPTTPPSAGAPIVPAPAVPSPAIPSPVAPSPVAPSPDAGPASLRGTLLDDKGHPLAGWSVGIAAADRWIVTDEKGRYAMELPLGPYELTVRDPQGKAQLTKAIRLVTSQGMELPLVVAIPVGELKGTVIDRQSKQGVGDATIRLFRQGETFNVASRDTGTYYLGDLPAGDYRVVVTRPRFQPYEGAVTIVAKQEKSLVVPLNPNPGSIAGKVSNLKGQGQPDVTVAIPTLKQTVTTDRQGAYTFKSLPPGEYEVMMTQGDRRIATSLVRVRSDETTTENVTVTPQVPETSQGGTISGQITDAVTRKPVSGVKIVVESGELTVLTISAADGRFTVSDLSPGTYRVTATKTGYKSRTTTARVTAKDGATVNMALTLGH